MRDRNRRTAGKLRDERSMQRLTTPAVNTWLVVALALLLVAMIGLIGYIIGRSTPPLATGTAQTANIDGLQVTMRLDSAAPGPRVIEVAVQDGSGNPVDVSAVQLHFHMQDMDMGTQATDAQPMGPGRFQAHGDFFTMVGRWQIDATVLRDHQP